jgi:YD repeat-containing protein
MADGRTLTFDYDGLGMLRRVSDEDGVTVRQLTTDYLGRLIVEADAAGNRTVHVGPSYEVRQPVGGTATVTKYLRDERGAAASIESDGSSTTVLYYRRDFKGSTTHTFSTDGTLVSELAYSGYGQWVRVSGTDDPELKYEQRFWTADLGLYYFGSRWYDPITGTSACRTTSAPPRGRGPSSARPAACSRGTVEAGFAKARPGTIGADEAMPLALQTRTSAGWVAEAVPVADLYYRPQLVLGSSLASRAVLVIGSSSWGISDAITEASGH